MAATRNPEIRRAADQLYVLSSSETVRAEYNHRQKAEMDYATHMEDHYLEGMEKGIETTARNALAEGASVEFIRKITGLDLETITKLASPKNTREPRLKN